MASAARQDTIGWKNEIFDVKTDRAAGRAKKPMSSGHACPDDLRVPILVSASLTIPLSFLAAARCVGDSAQNCSCSTKTQPCVSSRKRCAGIPPTTGPRRGCGGGKLPLLPDSLFVCELCVTTTRCDERNHSGTAKPESRKGPVVRSRPVSGSAACVTAPARANSVDRAGVLESFEIMLSDSQ